MLTFSLKHTHTYTNTYTNTHGQVYTGMETAVDFKLIPSESIQYGTPADAWFPAFSTSNNLGKNEMVVFWQKHICSEPVA